MNTKFPQFKIRMPKDIKDWIDIQSKTNTSSRSSEIIRAIRERMDKVKQEKAI